MKENIRVFVNPSDDYGCGRYRMRYPAEALIAKGYSVTVGKFPRLLSDGKKILGLETAFDYDVVVIQRPARMQYLDLIKYLQGKGIKVVVDMDDLLSDIHPSNPAFIPYQQREMHWKFCVEACLMADLVTCTTDALAETYGTDTNTVVLPNCIPERFLSIKRKRDEGDLITVGYAGLSATHPTDLQITHGAVNEALSKRLDRARFLALGDERALFNLGIRDRAPHGWKPGVPIDQYPEFISQIDIGLVPLEDSKFNRAKSALKFLEYMSVGAIPIGSPTPDNIRLQRETGIGFIAHNPKEWKEHIQYLVDNDDVRNKMSAQGREAAGRYTVEANAHKWYEAWSKIL